MSKGVLCQCERKGVVKDTLVVIQRAPRLGGGANVLQLDVGNTNVVSVENESGSPVSLLWLHHFIEDRVDAGCRNVG